MAMQPKDRRSYEARARIAKALAHPSRLLMLDLLRSQQMSVTELTDHVKADQSTVSKHLAILKEVGLVTVQKDGVQSFYQLKCNCLDGFFSCMEQVLVSELECRRSALD